MVPGGEGDCPGMAGRIRIISPETPLSDSRQGCFSTQQPGIGSLWSRCPRLRNAVPPTCACVGFSYQQRRSPTTCGRDGNVTRLVCPLGLLPNCLPSTGAAAGLLAAPRRHSWFAVLHWSQGVGSYARLLVSSPPCLDLHNAQAEEFRASVAAISRNSSVLSLEQFTLGRLDPSQTLSTSTLPGYPAVAHRQRAAANRKSCGACEAPASRILHGSRGLCHVVAAFVGSERHSLRTGRPGGCRVGIIHEPGEKLLS